MRKTLNRLMRRQGVERSVNSGSPISIKKGLNIQIPNRDGDTRVEVESTEIRRCGLRFTPEEQAKLIPCKGPRLSRLRMSSRGSLVFDLERHVGEIEGARPRSGALPPG